VGGPFILDCHLEDHLETIEEDAILFAFFLEDSKYLSQECFMSLPYADDQSLFYGLDIV
jgi:hypothetical protein